MQMTFYFSNHGSDEQMERNQRKIITSGWGLTGIGFLIKNECLVFRFGTLRQTILKFLFWSLLYRIYMNNSVI